METVWWSIIALGGIGAAFGFLLAIASKKLAVKKDEKVVAVRELLPSANCGGCGYPGCDGFAEALVRGEAKINGCAVLGIPAAGDIAELLGVSAGDLRPKAARIMCLGKEGCKDKFEYNGARDCRAALAVAGGFKNCKYACIGLGTCADTCKFDAISMDEQGIAAIDLMKCTGCGACEEICPQDTIKVLDLDIDYFAACRNPEKGKAVTSVCSLGCISCGICAKSCPFGAITMVENLPVFDYDKCRECGVCMEKCPRNTIVRTKPVKRAKIDNDKCAQCGKCMEVCPFGAIDEENGIYTVFDKCRGCGYCLEECESGAITMQKGEE
jgi:electron transport complex protein RnfB